MGVAGMPPSLTRTIPPARSPPVMTTSPAHCIQQVFETPNGYRNPATRVLCFPCRLRNESRLHPRFLGQIRCCCRSAREMNPGPIPKQWRFVRAGATSLIAPRLIETISHTRRTQPCTRIPISFLSRFHSPGIMGQIGRVCQLQAVRLFLASMERNIIWPVPSRFFG